MPLLFTFVVTFLAFACFTASRVLLSLFALHLGAAPATVGSIAAAFYIFPVLISWPVGVLADRFGSRWLMLAGSASAALGMAAPVVWANMTSLYIASILGGLCLAIYNVLAQNIVGLVSKPDQRTRNFAN